MPISRDMAIFVLTTTTTTQPITLPLAHAHGVIISYINNLISFSDSVIYMCIRSQELGVVVARFKQSGCVL